MLRKALIIAAFACATSSAFAAQRVVFDNDQIRVVRYTIMPGDTAKIAARRSLLYCLSNSELTAKVAGRQERLVCSIDVALWNDSPLWLNHFDGPAAEFLVVEVKSQNPLGTARPEDDGSRVAPVSFSVMFDNEHLRVLRFRSNPGERLPAHSHAANLLRYSVTPLRARVIDTSGTATEVNQAEGVAQWFAASGRQTWENLGASGDYALLIEVK